MNSTSTAPRSIVNETEFQRLVGEFVRQDVHHCVSMMFHAVAQVPESWSKMDLDEEDVYGLCSQPRWTADLDYTCPCGHEWSENVDDVAEDDPDSSEFPEACPACGEICDPNVTTHESDPREAYEHWIVSRFLADDLERMGEMVCRDFLGLTIWGRCTTGQAILLDWVICDIFRQVRNIESSRNYDEPKTDGGA